MKRSRATALATLVVAGGLTLPSCGGGGGGNTEPAAPLGPPTLTITSPAVGACVELGTDPDQTVLVEVALENWTLRPPGGCGSAAQCGYLVLFVDPVDGDERAPDASSAAPVINLKLGGRSDALGPHTLRVELRNGDDSVAITGDGGPPLRAELEVTVRASGTCSGTPPVDAGADAGPDADASTDGASDAPVDAANDDAGVDASRDGGADSPADTGTDSGADSSADASADVALDSPADADAEAGDSATDAPSDSASDALTGG